MTDTAPGADREQRERVARDAALASQIAGMIGRWYPQAASADGGRLLAECIVDGPVRDFVAALAAARLDDDTAAALERVRALADELDIDAKEAARLGEVYKANERWAGVAALDAKKWTSNYAAASIRAALGQP